MSIPDTALAAPQPPPGQRVKIDAKPLGRLRRHLKVAELDKAFPNNPVRAAAAMGVELTALNDVLASSWGVRLAMRTGVNTGELVIGEEAMLGPGQAWSTNRSACGSAPGW